MCKPRLVAVLICAALLALAGGSSAAQASTVSLLDDPDSGGTFID